MRVLVITAAVAWLAGCSGDGSTGQVDGGQDALEQDGAPVDSSADQADSSPQVDQPPAQDTSPADQNPPDEGGEDAPVDMAKPDMGQLDTPLVDMAEDTAPVDMQPADVAPDLSLPPNSYTCRLLANGNPSVRAVNGEVLRIDCDNDSFQNTVCELTEKGTEVCFRCHACPMPPTNFCAADGVRLIDYDLACEGDKGSGLCLYEEREVTCSGSCSNNVCG